VAERGYRPQPVSALKSADWGAKRKNGLHTRIRYTLVENIQWVSLPVRTVFPWFKARDIESFRWVCVLQCGGNCL